MSDELAPIQGTEWQCTHLGCLHRMPACAGATGAECGEHDGPRAPMELVPAAPSSVREEGDGLLLATTPHGPRAARVLSRRDGFFVVVERRRPNGSYGMFTYHLTRRGARRAAALWERHGDLEGWAP